MLNILFSLALAAPVPPSNLVLVPPQIFAYEDKLIKFRFTPSAELKLAEDEAYVLVKVESPEKTTPKEILGPLNDAGFLGDSRANDQVFGRSVQFKESRAGKVWIRVQKATKADPHHPTDLGLPPVALEVAAHPSFVELVKQVWAKIQTKF